MLTTFLAPAIFLIHNMWKKIEKWSEQKNFLHPKITFIMPVNHVMQFFQNVLYFHTFLPKLQTAPISFCLKINAPKLFQGFMITYYLVISGLLVDSPKVGMIYYVSPILRFCILILNSTICLILAVQYKWVLRAGWSLEVR